MYKRIGLLAAAALTSLVINCQKSESKTLNGAGATFPYPIYSAWSISFGKATGAKLNYQSIGSGGGIKQIENRTVDFGATDKPLKKEELEKSGLLQFPAIIGGVVPVVNIPGVDAGKLKLDGGTLCKIYMGDIKAWDDSAVKALNTDLKLPSKQITVVTRADGSGTTAVFTNYLNAVCKEWKEKIGSDTAVKFPVGISGKGNEGISNYIKQVEGSIGYVEFAYSHQNKLAHVLLKNAEGNFVEPSIESFQSAGAAAKFEASEHFYLWLTNALGKNSWPIAAASFILVAKDKPDSSKKAVQFFSWTFQNGDESAKKLIYVPLPEELKTKVAAYWKENGLVN